MIPGTLDALIFLKRYCNQQLIFKSGNLIKNSYFHFWLCKKILWKHQCC